MVSPPNQPRRPLNLEVFSDVVGHHQTTVSPTMTACPTSSAPATNGPKCYQPDHWMKPLEKGPNTGLVEIPANWYLDDLPPMMFIKKAPNSHGWVNPRDVEDLWRDHFDYFYREYDDFCFPVTIHPDVSGHPHVILMLER